MAEAVRDVVIRISLENGTSTFKMPETIQQSFDSIRKFEQSAQSIVERFAQTAASVSHAAGASIDSTLGGMRQHVQGFQTELDSVLNRYASTSGSLKPSLSPNAVQGSSPNDSGGGDSVDEFRNQRSAAASVAQAVESIANAEARRTESARAGGSSWLEQLEAEVRMMEELRSAVAATSAASAVSAGAGSLTSLISSRAEAIQQTSALTVATSSLSTVVRDNLKENVIDAEYWVKKTEAVRGYLDVSQRMRTEEDRRHNDRHAGQSSTSSSDPIEVMRRQFASARQEMEESRKAAEAGGNSTGYLSSQFMNASLSTGVLNASIAALTAGLKIYSVVANETRDINQNYWTDLANSSLSAGQHTFGRVKREISNEAAIRGVRSIDLTEVQTSPAINAARKEREERIQQEQSRLMDHPLSVRQEVRSRIEGQGNRLDELLKSESRMDRLTDRLERIDADEAKITDRLGLARREYEGTIRGIQAAKDNFQATRSGNFAGDWNRLFGDGTLGQASEDSYNPFGQMWDHSVAGETTLWDKFQHDKKLDITATKATASFERVESQSAAEMVKNDHERLSISREMSMEAQKRIGLIRDEQRESRLAAEQGREDLTNKMLRFGSADEGTKASLRNIQAKADQGQKLNHLEINLANSYGIDAARQARKQSLESAERPENARLFQEQAELQRGREDRQKEANSPKMQEAVEKMEQVLNSKGDEAAQIVTRIIDTMEHDHALVELLNTLERRITEQEDAIRRILAKSRSWF